MNIMHYIIGLPPERHGGSIQYAYSLMLEQAKTNNVYALICGDTLFRSKKCRFKFKKYHEKIQIYSLTNPLTPTLIYGAKQPKYQYRNIHIDYNNICNFIINNKISVLHIHTMMGLHKDIVSYIKTLGVKIIYTTHDFHGICIHCNLINEQGSLCSTVLSKNCALCNSSEPSDFFLRLVNSNLYQKIKKINIVSFIKSKKINSLSKDKCITKTIINDSTLIEYQNLKNYYLDYFSLFDTIHFNSSQTHRIFKQFVQNIKGKVISITTNTIKDKRKPLTNNSTIKLGYIGMPSEYKGFPLLKKIMIELYQDGIRNLKICTYSGLKPGIDKDCSLIEYMPPYKYNEISSIMYDMDAIIVPSKWYETFSLVTLESLSHGRPAIVSNHVGAQDIVAKYNPKLIFSSKEDLKSLLIEIATNSDFLKQENQKILSSSWDYSMEKHNYEIIKECYI